MIRILISFLLKEGAVVEELRLRGKRSNPTILALLSARHRFRIEFRSWTDRSSCGEHLLGNPRRQW